MGAQASVVLIDTFDTPAAGQYIYDPVSGLPVATGSYTGAVNPAGTVLGRTVTTELTQGSNAGAPPVVPPGSGANVRINQLTPLGTFAVSNISSANSLVTVSWTLPVSFIAAPVSALGEASIVFDLLYSDIMPTVATFSYDGVVLGSLTMPIVTPVTQPGIRESFSLTAAQQLAISSGNNKVLSMSLAGPLDWDFRMDNFGIDVPEPGTLPLVALALLAVAGCVRSRKH
jgi:hypothetical protein